MARRHRFTKKDRPAQLALGDNRVVSYVRASTEEQVNSLDAQVRRHRDFAKDRGIEIDETFTGKGVSATATDFLDRTEVKAMLRHCKGRGINSILLLRVDRVFRSTRDFNLSMVELEKRGVFLRFIDPDINYATPIGRMFITQQVLMAEYEGQLRGQRQDDSYDTMRERRVARVANAIPYGWIADGESSVVARTTGRKKLSLKPHPGEQAVLRWMKQEHERDPSYGVWTRIANALNADGIPTKHGSTWKPGNVKSVLQHEVLARPDELDGPLPSLEEAARILTP